MNKITLAVLLVSLTSLSAFAEIALLCGDAKAISEKESNAQVHVDFDDRIIKNKDEVKFLSVLGVDREIKFARMVEGARIFVRTEKESFLFSKIDSCNGEDSEDVEVTVTVSNGREFPCTCHED